MEWKLLENGRYEHVFKYVIPGCKHASVHIALSLPEIPKAEIVKAYLEKITKMMDEDASIQKLAYDPSVKAIELYYSLLESYLP